MSEPGQRKIPLVAVLTAFLDLIGFSIIFPLFPHMLEHYLALEGAESVLGRGVALLRDAAAGSANSEFLVTVLFGAVTSSSVAVTVPTSVAFEEFSGMENVALFKTGASLTFVRLTVIVAVSVKLELSRTVT